jgi:hypothetical protein
LIPAAFWDTAFVFFLRFGEIGKIFIRENVVCDLETGYFPLRLIGRQLKRAIFYNGSDIRDLEILSERRPGGRGTCSLGRSMSITLIMSTVSVVEQRIDRSTLTKRPESGYFVLCGEMGYPLETSDFDVAPDQLL